MPEQGGHIAGSNSTSTTLIEKLKSGDEDSWSYFLFVYRPLILVWAKKFGAGSNDAADVAQEVVSNVVRGIVQFEKSKQKGSFRKWLKVITQRRTVDFLRKRQRSIQADGGSVANEKIQQVPDPIDDEIHESKFDEQSIVLQRTLAYLKTRVKPHNYEAFHRYMVEGQDAQDVAADLNVSVDVVYQATRRMLKRLRKRLGEEFEKPQ